jgi:hypothetical protein
MTTGEIIRQGVRYLRAAEQDTHPVYGLTHASYAHTIFEGLALEGLPVMQLLHAASAQQDRWGMMIVERFPFQRT